MVLESVSYELLCEELDRLAERFKHSEIALEAIQAVHCWAIEETVPNA